MIKSSPKTMRYQALFAHLWISGMSTLFCTLLLLAFPYGIPYPDTGSFLANALTFGLFTHNGNDWARTIPFGALLKFSLLFSRPSLIVPLVHCSLFIIVINLVLWSTRPLFQSLWTPLIIATALLIMEVSLMRVFFYNVILLADAPYSHLVLIGALLVLGSWLRQKPTPLYLGFFILGLAWFVKPVGLALLPSWGLFAILGTRDNALRWPHTWWKRATLSLLLFLAPTLLWSTRNAIVYRSFHSSAMSGFQALAGVLPFVEDGDTLLKDSEKNEQFMKALRTFEKQFGIEFNTYLYQDTKEAPNPFRTLAYLLPPKNPDANPPTGFSMNTTHWALTVRIALAHPKQVLYHIIDNYLHFLRVSPILPQDPLSIYQTQLSSLSEEHRKLLYPPHGSFKPTTIDKRNFHVLQHLDISLSLLQKLKQHDLFIMNIVFHGLLVFSLFSVMVHYYVCRKPTIRLLHTSLFILMLLSITFFHNIAAAVAGPPIERYALPGEMPLHFAILLTVVMLLSGIRSRICLTRR